MITIKVPLDNNGKTDLKGIDRNAEFNAEDDVVVSVVFALGKTFDNMSLMDLVNNSSRVFELVMEDVDSITSMEINKFFANDGEEQVAVFMFSKKSELEDAK